MPALPPQSVTGFCAYANMARSRCYACYFKQPHICSDTDPTLYSPDAVSLRDLKLQDQSPVVRAIPEPAMEGELQPRRDSILQPEPSVVPATPKSHSRSWHVSDREPSVGSEEPTAHSTPRLSPRSDFSIKSKARSARGGLGPFPHEWHKGWEPHPTTPDLFWISRTWSNGMVEYILHYPDLKETRRYWLPPGGDEFDFDEDPWAAAKRQRDSMLYPAPARGFHGLASPSALSDSSGDTVIGEAPGSHFHETSPKMESRSLGIWEANTLQLLWHDEAERRRRADAKRDQRTREKEEKRRRREKEKEDRRMFEEYQRRVNESERQKQEEKKRRETERKMGERLYMIRKGGKNGKSGKKVIVTSGKSLRR